jgi:hypothetical protein
LNYLEQSRAQIEQEIGQPLLWNANPDSEDKIIALYRDADPDDQISWPKYCDWLVDMTEKFINAFRPRIRNLDLTPDTVEPVEPSA